jgi:hypothetical protein
MGVILMVNVALQRRIKNVVDIESIASNLRGPLQSSWFFGMEPDAFHLNSTPTGLAAFKTLFSGSNPPPALAENAIPPPFVFHPLVSVHPTSWTPTTSTSRLLFFSPRWLRNCSLEVPPMLKEML